MQISGQKEDRTEWSLQMGKPREEGLQIRGTFTTSGEGEFCSLPAYDLGDQQQMSWSKTKLQCLSDRNAVLEKLALSSYGEKDNMGGSLDLNLWSEISDGTFPPKPNNLKFRDRIFLGVRGMGWAFLDAFFLNVLFSQLYDGSLTSSHGGNPSRFRTESSPKLSQEAGWVINSRRIIKSGVLKAIGEHLLPAGIPFITPWADGHTTASCLE